MKKFSKRLLATGRVETLINQHIAPAFYATSITVSCTGTYTLSHLREFLIDPSTILYYYYHCQMQSFHDPRINKLLILPSTCFT